MDKTKKEKEVGSVVSVFGAFDREISLQLDPKTPGNTSKLSGLKIQIQYIIGVYINKWLAISRTRTPVFQSATTENETTDA